MAEELPFKTTMNFAYGEPRELAPGVVRIVANNPSPFTFKGTNTYIVGTGATLALIDPGPDDPAHLEAILEDDRRPADRRTSSSRTPTATTPTACRRCWRRPVPRRWASGAASPTAAPSAPARRAASSWTRISCRTSRSPTASGSRATAGRSRRCTRPGTRRITCASRWRARAILFSGDHVMGWNTSVVAPPEGNMGDYIRSLRDG